MSDQYLNSIIAKSAENSGINPGLLRALLLMESNLGTKGVQPNPKTGVTPPPKSKAGAVGIAQFMPQTAKSLKVDPTNPIDSIHAAGAYLSDMINRFGGVDKGLAAYNMGPTALSQSLKTGRKLPLETRVYTQKVQGLAPTEQTKFGPDTKAFDKYLPGFGLTQKSISELATWKPPKYGLRPDNTPKGEGYFGALPGRLPGQLSSELSVGVGLNGKEQYMPSIVPGLSPDELDYLLAGGKPGMEPGLMDKIVGHAKARIGQGQSPYAREGEQQPYTYQPTQPKEQSTLSQLLAGAAEPYQQLMQELQSMTPVPGLFWTPPLDQKQIDRNFEQFMSTRRGQPNGY